MVYSYNGYYIRLSAERQGFNSLIDRQLYALLAQLVEALVLGTSQCGFESHVRHHWDVGLRAQKHSPLKESDDAVDLGIGSYLRVAQFGSASDLGSEGRGFKSHLVDHMQ